MFAGIITRSPTLNPNYYINSKTALNVLTPYQQADQTGVWENRQALIVKALTWNTPHSKQEASPYQCPHSKLIIASWLRLDNRQELACTLNLNELLCLTDPMLVLAAYRKWGKACADKLEGDFSFVIYDPNKNECFAARDSIGVKPFYYYLDKQVFIFSTTAALFPRLTHFDLAPNQNWVALHLIHESMSFTETGFESVLKLAPAHYLDVTQNTTSLQRYFSFKDDAPSVYQRDEKWVKDYREKLDDAHIARMNSAYLIGSETSGGIDSSTVTALAALNLPHDKRHFHVFGYALLEQEPAYLLQTSQFHNIPHNHIYTCYNPEEEQDALFEREMKVLGYPCEYGIASNHMMFYRQCEQYKIRTLLSGFGGDEVVTNQGSLLAQELIKAGRYITLFNEMPGNPLMALLRAGKRIYTSHTKKDPSHTGNTFRKKCLPSLIISSEADWQYQLTEQYLKASRYDEGYQSINEFILENRLVPFLSTRTDNCTLMAAAFKVDYRWPLLDRRLIQQYLSTPAIEKHSRLSSRYLHRRAVEDIVPKKVVWKSSKYMGEHTKTYNDNHDTTIHLKGILDTLTSASLHEILKPLVNEEKLQQQIQYLKYDNSRGFNEDSFILRKNCVAVYKLNKWLQYYFG